MERDDTRKEPINTARASRRRHHGKRVSLIRFLLLAFMLLGASRIFAANPVNLDIAVRGLGAAQPPRLVEDVLVLSFRPSLPVRFVGARFAHESWKILHAYALNENGVFILDYPLPEGVREIRYRIVVDGLWMADPTNPRVEMDVLGNEFSVFTLEKEPVRPMVNPRREGSGVVTFTFRAAPGRRVAITGDFNNWDPFMDILTEISPGTYVITLRVPAGGHWYCFFSDGRRILDMFNPETGEDPDGSVVSYFSLSF